MTNNDIIAVVFVVGMLILYGIYYGLDLIRRTLGVTWEELGFLTLLMVLYILCFWYINRKFQQHPQGTLLSATFPIWVPYAGIAWLVLLLVRNQLVRRWALEQAHERQIVIAWLRHIPVGLTLVWAFLLNLWLTTNWHWSLWVALPLTGGSTGLMVFLYYHLYFKYQPKQPDWTVFVAEYHTWKLERKLARLERKVGV